MKKLFNTLSLIGLTILSTVGIGNFSVAAQNNDVSTIKENTPLYLEHASVISNNNIQGNTILAGHHSHYSHGSHESHYSHRSHYSGY